MPADDRKAEVLKAVEQTGFPLELRVSEMLQSRGYFVANSVYYIDQDEGKGREIDIRAVKNYDFVHNQEKYFVRHCLLLECKRMLRRPWVIFTSPATGYDRGLGEPFARGLPSSKWMDKGLGPILEKIHPVFQYRRRGRGFTELFKGEDTRGTDNVFRSVVTAAKAAAATHKSKFASGARNICFFYPMVVLDGELWDAHLNGPAMDAIQAEAVVVSFHYESPTYKNERLLIPVVTTGHLPVLIDALDAMHETIGTHFQGHPEWFPTT